MGQIFDIACMGTSLTAGSGNDGVNLSVIFGSFTVELAKAFPGKQSHVRVYNVGTPGVNSDYGLANHLPIVKNLKPRAVLIEYMVNDCLSGGPSTSASTANYNAIIDALKALPVPPSIYLTTMNPVVGSGSAAIARSNLATYNALLSTIATNKSVNTIVPSWGSPTLTDVPDGVHPTLAFNVAKLIPAIVAGLGASIS